MEENTAQSEHTSSIESESNNVVFTLSPVDEKPRKRGSKKASQSDIILDAFMEGKDKLVEIRSEGKNVHYLLYAFRYELNKRIDARKLKKISTFILNKQLFLEKE